MGGFWAALRSARTHMRMSYHLISNSHPPKTSQYHQKPNQNKGLMVGNFLERWEDRGPCGNLVGEGPLGAWVLPGPPPHAGRGDPEGSLVRLLKTRPYIRTILGHHLTIRGSHAGK